MKNIALSSDKIGKDKNLIDKKYYLLVKVE